MVSLQILKKNGLKSYKLLFFCPQVAVEFSEYERGQGCSLTASSETLSDSCQPILDITQ